MFGGGHATQEQVPHEPEASLSLGLIRSRSRKRTTWGNDVEDRYCLADNAIFPDRAVSLACFRESFPCSLE